MNNRNLLRLVLLSVLSLLGTEPLQARERPNIVFILADDMGWPDVACYGHKFHDTPVIDRLAQQGMKFTNFYAATPVCSSTRSTIQTGQYSARTGITDFIPGHWRPFEKLVVPEIDHNLREGIKTPGNAIKAAGYVTGYFGKWHLGNDREHQPDRHGYDVTERQLGKEFRESRTTKTPGPKRIDFLTDASLWFIEQNKDKPFFLTLSHHAVHIPVQGNAATIAKYEKKAKPAEGVNHPIYAAMVEDLDTSVGRILKKLDELKLSNDTIVVFTSDNGGLRKIYTGVGEVVSTNAPLRDEKGTLYEGGIRVPMIVRWPGVVEPGSVHEAPTTTADLLPTFCAMADAALPGQPIDGASLVTLLKNPEASLDREAIYFHYPHYHHSEPAGAIRAGDWKLIEFLADGRLELYNLRDDIGERKNLATTRPELAKDLQQKLANWRRKSGARMPTVNPKADAKRAAQWWSRRSGEPLDIEAMRKRYDSKRSNPVAKPAATSDRKSPRRTLNRAFACADYGGNKICLVDRKGKITWQYPAQRPQDVWVLANGNILFSHLKGAIEVTRDKEIAWEYKTAEGNEIQACQPLPDGKVMVAESGPMQIVEVDRSGKITRTVKLQTECKRAHGQMRCARKTAQGTYIIGQYSDNVVREYDSTGKIIREIPQKMAFGGIRLPNGNTLVATGDAHRLYEIDPNDKIVWEVNENDLPGNPLRFVAGLQRLPNGNTLVCNWGGHGHIGKQPQIFEVTPDKKVVGEIFDYEQFSTLSGVVLRDVEEDPSKFEVHR